MPRYQRVNSFFSFIQSTSTEDSTALIARSTFTTRYQLITLGCALLAAAPRATGARLQPAFINSGLPFVKSLRQCLPLRGLHRALPQTRAHTMAASTGPGYAQKRYIPLQVESSITYEDIATFPRPGSVPCPSHDAFKTGVKLAVLISCSTLLQYRCSAPDSIAFSPDDSVVTYLASSDGSLSRQLYAMDIVSGQVIYICI